MNSGESINSNWHISTFPTGLSSTASRFNTHLHSLSCVTATSTCVWRSSSPLLTVGALLGLGYTGSVCTGELEYSRLQGVFGAFPPWFEDSEYSKVRFRTTLNTREYFLAIVLSTGNSSFLFTFLLWQHIKLHKYSNLNQEHHGVSAHPLFLLKKVCRVVI